MNKLESLFLAINRWALILMLAAMSCIIMANVALRHLTGDSIIWAEEVARHLMVWLTFIGAGLVLRHGGHVAIDNLHSVLPLAAARALRAGIVLAMLLFFVVMIWQGIVYMQAMSFQTTPATGIPFIYIYVGMPIGFVLMGIHLLLISRDYILHMRFRPSQDIEDADSAADHG